MKTAGIGATLTCINSRLSCMIVPCMPLLCVWLYGCKQMRRSLHHRGCAANTNHTATWGSITGKESVASPCVHGLLHHVVVQALLKSLLPVHGLSMKERTMVMTVIQRQDDISLPSHLCIEGSRDYLQTAVSFCAHPGES